MQEMQETQSDIMRTMEEIPTQAYIGFTFGSVLLSAFFYLIGKRSTALFVGQWAPTLGVLALVYKLLHPSQEQPIEQMRHVGEQMRHTGREMGSRVSQ